MHTKTLNSRWIAGGAALALWMALPFAANAEDAQATLSPSSISVYDSAELRIPAQGNVSPEAPAVPGLLFQQAGQSSEMSVVNGRVSQHAWALYQVSARRPGTYRIPIGGQQLTLSVSPAGVQPGPSIGAQSPTGSPGTQPTGTGSSPLAFLRTELPKGKLYVGQAIPIAFKAYFRPGTEVTIAAPPSLNNPTFTVSDLSEKPIQGTQTIGGREYATATWSALISGTLPGSSSTEVTMPIAIRYREASQSRRSAFGDPFGGSDPFADDPTVSSMFKSMLGSGLGSGFSSAFQGFEDPFVPVRERELTLRSPAQGLTLLPLPLAGRPRSFSGAVGHFQVETQLTPSAGVAFEPLNLEISVSGQGNFDRVAIAGLESTPDFKGYPESSRFEPKSAHSTFTGTKTFLQPVVPQRAGAIVLPPIAFSFFDPKTAAYVTEETAPLHVTAAQAAPSAPMATLSAQRPGDSSAASAIVPPETASDGLRPNHDPSGEGATLTVPARQAWFWVALLFPVVGLLLALVLARRRGLGPSLRTSRRAMRATLNTRRREMRQAVERRDAPGFFNAAQAVVQAELGQLWHVDPEAVTDDEVHRRLGKKGLPLADALRTAASVLYGGARVDPDALPDCDAALESLLDQLEVAS